MQPFVTEREGVKVYRTIGALVIVNTNDAPILVSGVSSSLARYLKRVRLKAKLATPIAANGGTLNVFAHLIEGFWADAGKGAFQV